MQQTSGFHVIARTEALIAGHSVDEAIQRCQRYVEAGADSVLVHSKAPSKDPILEFLNQWDKRAPVVIVPTTYPDWMADDAYRAGASVIIYANQTLRAMVRSARQVLETIHKHGSSLPVEEHIAPLAEIFELQRLEQWLQGHGRRSSHKIPVSAISLIH